MKKFLTIAAAFALVLGLSQCRKPNAPTINGGNGETQHVTLTSSFGGDGSKLDVQTVLGSLNLKWEVDDVISIAEPNHGSLVCVSASYDEDTKVSTGTFEGTITHNSGDITFTVGTEPSYTEQDGGEINEDKIYLVGTSEYKSDGNYNVQMKLPYAILKLDLSAFGATDKASGNEVEIFKGEETEPIATVIGVTTASNKMYVVMPTDDTERTYTFTGNGKTAKYTWTLEGNKYYTAGGSGGTIVVAPEEQEPICFSVGLNGNKLKAVSIASSNMYWDGDSYKFRYTPFERAPEWADDDVDLFMFNGDPKKSRDRTWQGTLPEVFYTNATATTPSSSFTIGGETGVWRLLSRAEWEFLTGALRDGAFKSLNGLDRMFGFLKVDGQLGFVIFPDNYKTVGHGPSTEDLQKDNIYITDDPTTCTNASTEKWNLLAGHGVVFLPLTGYRNGNGIGGTPGETKITNQDIDGVYMTSNKNTDNINGNIFTFSTNKSGDSYYWCGSSAANYAKGVRLVKNLADQPVPTR